MKIASHWSAALICARALHLRWLVIHTPFAKSTISSRERLAITIPGAVATKMNVYKKPILIIHGAVGGTGFTDATISSGARNIKLNAPLKISVMINVELGIRANPRSS